MSVRPVQETHALASTIRRLVDDTNLMWQQGRLPRSSVIHQVHPELTAVQYSPRFEDGPWRAESALEWLDGTAQAAEALADKGCRWSLHDLVVLPRDTNEAVASYRIVHERSDEREPAQALFLETWRRSERGDWELLRHTAEKV